ncbi:MAG: TonB-dependent receptor [Parasphingorhabdus sp.]|uniref:TonB-dependent receptor domain-containing protein n=1 Tax=Parasphingorhabdus sp. TaxID=2709688 RepID=UPI00329774BC
MRPKLKLPSSLYLRPYLTSVGAVALAVSSAGAQAQDQTQDSAGDEDMADIIVVTGSRITNPNLELSSPVTVLGREAIDRAPSLTAEELIRELPGVVADLGSAVNNGNEGSAEINLRGLGSNRNLVLLNNSRLVPAGLTGVTDTNLIPLALVERVDIVTGGGGTVYGADAISGVVNFILKRDFEGAEISSSYGVTEEGDGSVFRTDVTLGGNFADDRGNAVLSIGYRTSDPVLQGDRPFGFQSLSSGSGNPLGSGTSVPTAVNGQQFNPDTGLLQDDINTFNFNPFNYYQTPFERFNIFGAAHFEVADGIEVYGQGLYSRNIVETQFAPSGLFGTTYNLPLSNPFLTDALRDQICAQNAVGINQADCDAAAAITDPNDPAFQAPAVTLNRRLVEQGNRQQSLEFDVFQIEAGVRGNISDSIEWDIHAAHGRSERVRSQNNSGLNSRIQQALFAIDADTCIDPTNGCVPINLFGSGQDITPEAVAFFNQPVSATTKTELTVVTGSVSGDVGFAFPWADTPVNFAIGAEYRDNIASIVPDIASGTPDEVLGNGLTLVAQSGSYNVTEFFGEIVAPLVEDRPFFHSLTLELGGRYSDYSNTGGNFTWKAGGSWEPVEGLKLRGIYQRAVRSPNIEELFAPIVTGLDNFLIDPCQGANPVGNAALTAVCLAQGAPAGTIGAIPAPSAGQINATFGGNPDLDVEKARTITLGAIFQPAAIPGLTLSVDYYDILVTDAITTETVGDIFGPCFASLDPNSPQCQQIVRNPLNGSLNGGAVDTPGAILNSSNEGRLETSGIDFTLGYQRDLDFATLGLQVSGNFTLENKFQSLPTSINRECAGFYSVNCSSIQPEFQLNSRISLSDERGSISLGWRHISGQDFEPGAADLADIFDAFESIPSYNVFDLALGATVADSLDLTFVVDNLFDKRPPIVGNTIGSTAFNSGNSYPATYDALGRRYTVGAKLRF